MLYAELFLTLGGAALVAWFTPHSPFAWALGILMFFLVQSLYFVAFEDKDVEAQVEVDPFETALWKAEKTITN